MRQVIDMGHGLNLERAEDAVLRLARVGGTAPTLVDLENCRHVDVGASWLLGNALAHFRGRGDLTVRVPEPGDFSGFWFLHFTRTGLGHAVARHASEIIGPAGDIESRVREYYRSKSSWIGSNCALIEALHEGAIDAGNEAQFSIFVQQLFASATYSIALLGERGELSALGRFLFEAAQNVYDHATRGPGDLAPEHVLSYLSVARYSQIWRPKSREHPFTEYPARVATHEPFSGFVVVTVCDDGNGIASRHSQRASFDDQSFDLERASVIDALRPGHSVKLRASDCEVRGDPGYGLSRIGEALKSLRAFATIRTGRVLVTFDATTDAEFRVADEPLGRLPGTAIQVVFPNTQALDRQLKLPFD